jgi:hypothetical protein
MGANNRQQVRGRRGGGAATELCGSAVILDWKRLIAFLAVIVLGSIVATEVLANSYRFHPALGFNLFHI